MVVTADDVRFDGRGLVPAVVQEAGTGEVLMVGYMNREALEKTLETGYTWFYSRSRNRLWQKGETSGHIQRVREVLADCDHDTLLIRVDQEGPGACHEGYKSCFHDAVDAAPGGAGVVAERTFDPARVYGGRTAPDAPAGEGAAAPDPGRPETMLDALYRVIASRKERPVEGSYTSYLFRSGIDKILKKVGEETAEVIIAGKGRDVSSLVMESADLIYHLLVLLVESGVRPEEVWSELAKRRGGGGSEDVPPGK